MTTLFRASGICKHYPIGHGLRRSSLHAVDEASFEIGDGECVGLVGESGCGKSTLSRIVARLIEPTSGTLEFAGAEIGSIPLRRFAATPERKSIQAVFQDPKESLNPSMTAFQSIADPVERLGAHHGRHELVDIVRQAAVDVGISSDLLYRYPHQLSGGQAARVGIARAIVLKPKLLVLDEPTSALDVSVQSTILHLLADLRDKMGMSYLFVSHDLNVVRLICDRIIVMYLDAS
jgi:ABC-type oligopeptide transport system ATPase subunit